VAAAVRTPFTRGLTAGAKTLLENRAIRRNGGPARSRRRDQPACRAGLLVETDGNPEETVLRNG
jgi:hypothetical protein